MQKYLTKAIRLPNGKRKYVRGKTQAELDEKVRKLQAELALGIDVSDTSTFKEYADIWLRQVKEPNVSPNTLSALTGFLKNHIYPVLGARAIRDIRATHIREVMLQCRSLSRPVQGKILSLMRAVFNAAVDDGLILRSPVPLTMKPTGAPPVAKEALTPEQEQEMLAAAEGLAIYPVLFLLMKTGLRRGEATGLMWSDVDLAAGVIHVRRHVVTDQSGKPELKEGAKTAAGVRDVPIPPSLAAFLTERRKSTSSVYVFPTENNTIYSAAALSIIWRSLQKRLPFHVTPHALRHTYATKLFEAGLDIKEVQRILGHSNPKITMQIYTHYRESLRWDSTAEKVKEAIG